MKKLLARLQDRLATVLGLEPERRTPIVRAMLHRPRGDAAGYWLQLGIAAALATLGLALDSTAVVIGAMLIAPLMRPIVELAMGLATGSTPLVFRTGLRAISSIVIVVGAAALFTWLLPFHEVTPELLARTAPTLLDLFVAAACALAGAYAVVTAGNDMATTAAGTSIGISLVPPLCTAGYGLAIADWDMAVGASLLFTANVTGIIVVASGVFVLVGFGQVNMREEEASLDADINVGTATRLGRVMSRRGARLSVIPRLLLPLVLLAGVAYPLLRAVDAMSHRSSVRQRVESLMKASSADRIVQYALDQTSRPITLRVVVVGDVTSARAMEQRLKRELAAVGEPNAGVAVWAVSDARALSALSARLADVPAVMPVEAPVSPPLPRRVRGAWPAQTAGPLITLWVDDREPPHVRVTHLGPELGAAGRELFAKAISLDGVVPVVDEIALVPIEAQPGGLDAWLPLALQLLARVRDLETLHACVVVPAAPTRRTRPDPADELTRKLLELQVAANPNAAIRIGDAWRIVPQQTTCQATP
jgi:uncharacterized hydrophobic protein (TIGR00271 family)